MRIKYTHSEDYIYVVEIMDDIKKYLKELDSNNVSMVDKYKYINKIYNLTDYIIDLLYERKVIHYSSIIDINIKDRINDLCNGLSTLTNTNLLTKNKDSIVELLDCVLMDVTGLLNEHTLNTIINFHKEIRTYDQECEKTTN